MNVAGWLLMGSFLLAQVGADAQSPAPAHQSTQETWLTERATLRKELDKVTKAVDARIAGLERDQKKASFEGRSQFKEAIAQIGQERDKLRQASRRLEQATAENWTTIKRNVGKTIRDVETRLRPVQQVARPAASTP